MRPYFTPYNKQSNNKILSIYTYILLQYFSLGGYIVLNTLLFLEMFLDLATIPYEHVSWPETRAWVGHKRKLGIWYTEAVYSAEFVRVYSNVKSKVYKIGYNVFCRGLFILNRLST